MERAKIRSILAVASKILVWLIIVMAAFMMIFTVFSKLMFDKSEPSFLGFRCYIVASDSMSLSEKNKDDAVHFNAGDIVFVKNVIDPAALQPGEVISFISQNKESKGQTVTHKIREVRVDGNGQTIGYVTYGTNTGVDDQVLAEPDHVLGAYAGKLPAVGYFFQFLKTTVGFFLFILLPFFLLIVWQGIDTIGIFKQYKREQLQDMEAERQHLAQERAESDALMQELQALREQLTKQKGGAEALAALELAKTDHKEAVTTDCFEEEAR